LVSFSGTLPPYKSGEMSVPSIGFCCFKDRAVVLTRCDLCKAEYGCPEFKSKAAAMKFNAMIPPSMILAPLPIELWPNMCAAVSLEVSVRSTESASSESTASPVRRLGSILGLPADLDTHST
jgi:hypothetical protein